MVCVGAGGAVVGLGSFRSFSEEVQDTFPGGGVLVLYVTQD